MRARSFGSSDGLASASTISDVDACKRRGVEVRSAVGTDHVSVAEYVLGRCWPFRARCSSQRRRSPKDGGPGRPFRRAANLRAATLGLVGFGLIAHARGSRRALGMHVRAFDPMLSADDTVWAEHGVRPLSFDELIAGGDV